jgi:hypothetical protein
LARHPRPRPRGSLDRGWREDVQFRTTVSFEELGRNRTRLTLHALFASAAERERAIKEYHADKGAMEAMSRLADHLAKLTS